ncbi:MAG: beta-galactosidase [Lentisphaerae bacterium]|nr:beta-galactosidase [Lentisphaerota bacterium]
MKKKAAPPYFGAAYYPEAWPLEQVDEDIALMKKAGMNVMRVAEFAWSRMEPQEGSYDFDWLHTVVDKLGKAGIAAIMCTPTATPPAWLTSRYPEVLFVDENGVPNQHGARRHVCSNSPVYRGHCGRIVTALAREFGRDPNVIGWQIDNELYPHSGRGCCCPVCLRMFHDAMRARFGTIEALNAAWCNRLWSQDYTSFAELPVPRSSAGHHPSLLTAWMRFQSDSYAAFCSHQAGILHRLTVKQPVGTDMMPGMGLSYHDIHRSLDLVQYNHYCSMDSLWEAPFWMDICRPIKPAPFWNTETSTCWNGGGAANGYRESGFCRANSWLPFALGGEANLYWLWRAHRAGQELMHGSVVSSAGRPLHIFDEVREVAAGLRKAGPFLNGTRPVNTGLAIHYSCLAWWLFTFQPIVKSFSYHGSLVRSVWRPLVEKQYRPDLIDAAADLAPYRLVLSPFLPALDEAGLRGRLLDWIRAGGAWVAGPFTDIRDTEATKFPHGPYGSMEEWAGVRVRYEIPGDPRTFGLRFSDGAETQGSLWFDSYELAGGRALALYTEGPMKGLAAAVERKIGKGRIILLGTQLPPAAYLDLFAGIAAKAGVKPVAEADPNLLVVPREGPAGRGRVVVETGNRKASLKIERPVINLLTGRRHVDVLNLPPCGVAVLKEVRS